jgi:hypothetical protein
MSRRLRREQIRQTDLATAQRAALPLERPTTAENARRVMTGPAP